MVSKALFTSDTAEWQTPKALFNALADEFDGFDLDPAATAANAKCTKFYTEEQDGLTLPWTGQVFCNPPYTGWRQYGIERWVEKGHMAAYYGEAELVVMLLPARTDTLWFQKHCMRAQEIRFIQGRLKFNGSKNPAPFPNVIVIWRPRLLAPMMRAYRMPDEA